ncbi:hypothetical protein MiYa_00287 [Microcystis aeruginosa NIES-2519]|uniref:Uncharacterized protein n=1 Tax=Microcystis aeruginosa NIES-2519 TaxID=2303981 RepID=A0A5A5R6L6_MICAE|nr:hypothetical protein MiYa_00287 [Microcystis aeruginosa NIES-2519]GCA86385.1 hypothetical protein MiHa_04376 [Microcystis aeruginosa NIES-2522]
MIDLCVLCVWSGSFHSLALEECILEYILPTKPGRANFLPRLYFTFIQPTLDIHFRPRTIWLVHRRKASCDWVIIFGDVYCLLFLNYENQRN